MGQTQRRLHILGAELRQDGRVKAVAAAPLLEPALASEATRLAYD